MSKFRSHGILWLSNSPNILTSRGLENPGGPGGPGGPRYPYNEAKNNLHIMTLIMNVFRSHQIESLVFLDMTIPPFLFFLINILKTHTIIDTYRQPTNTLKIKNNNQF